MASLKIEPAHVRSIRRLLIWWYPDNHRALPWRQEADPYRVWVSEIMLQQTRVESVIPYYERFLKEFPNVEVLAAAPLERVLKLWEKLGYYSRARNLHRAAKIIVDSRNGQMPRNAEEWLSLPGIGRYTAGAIASACYNERVPILDGNVKRVLSRIFAVAQPVESNETLKLLWSLAEELVPARHAGIFNQAIMELGATVCKPRNPSCPACPISRVCLARQQNRQDELPVRRRKNSVPHRRVVAAVIERKGSLLLGRRPESGMLGGLWEFPGGKVEPGESNEMALERELAEECGLDVEIRSHVTTVAHAYSHFTISLFVYRCRILRGHPKANYHEELRWIPRKDLSLYALPAANLKFLNLL